MMSVTSPLDSSASSLNRSDQVLRQHVVVEFGVCRGAQLLLYVRAVQAAVLWCAYSEAPLSIQVRKRSTSSVGQRWSQGMLPSASRP